MIMIEEVVGVVWKRSNKEAAFIEILATTKGSCEGSSPSYPPVNYTIVPIGKAEVERVTCSQQFRVHDLI